MKKFVLFLQILLILLTSCSKKQPILGVRKDVFLNGTSFEVLGNKKDIKISKAETFKNYYGDNSILNDIIENYRVEGMNFKEYNISRKKFGVKFYFFSSPIIVNNIVYYLDTNGNLISKNLNNLNKAIWKTKIIEKSNFINYYGGKISYYDGVVFITTRLNEVIAVLNDGTVKWRKKINAIPISAPIIDNGTVYTITNDNKLYALNEEDGKIKWIHYGNVKDSAILGSANPVIYKDYVVASYSSGELFILNKENGEVVFNTNITGKYMIFSNFELTDIDSTPVIKDNILVATANNGVTTAVDLNIMKIIWKQNLPSLTNVLVNDSFVYLITTDNIVICLNLKDGKINWFNQLDKYKNMEKKKNVIFYRSLVFLNDQLLAFNNMGEYKIINPITGEIIGNKILSFIFLNTPYSLNKKLYGIGYSGSSIKFLQSSVELKK